MKRGEYGNDTINIGKIYDRPANFATEKVRNAIIDDVDAKGNAEKTARLRKHTLRLKKRQVREAYPHHSHLTQMAQSSSEEEPCDLPGNEARRQRKAAEAAQKAAEEDQAHEELDGIDEARGLDRKDIGEGAKKEA